MPEIERTQIIVVDEVGQNTYGDLTFTDKEGNSYKVSTKRRKYFDDVVKPGTAVQLNYSTAYNKEYIYSAVQVEGGLSESTTPQPRPEGRIKEKSREVTQSIAPQERGMWWKEVGENFRAGLFKKDEGNGALLWKAYVAQMLSSLEIEIKRKED